jgi:hypothetical protein
MKTDTEVQLMLRSRTKGKTLAQAAARAGMSVPTARKYLRAAARPSELRQPRRCGKIDTDKSQRTERGKAHAVQEMWEYQHRKEWADAARSATVSLPNVWGVYHNRYPIASAAGADGTR